jgi:hypothetical protein
MKEESIYAPLPHSVEESLSLPYDGSNNLLYGVPDRFIEPFHLCANVYYYLIDTCNGEIVGKYSIGGRGYDVRIDYFKRMVSRITILYLNYSEGINVQRLHTRRALHHSSSDDNLDGFYSFLHVGTAIRVTYDGRGYMAKYYLYTSRNEEIEKTISKDVIVGKCRDMAFVFIGRELDRLNAGNVTLKKSPHNDNINQLNLF